MTAITTIKFTQDQMRTLTGLSSETVRHWRKTVPYLATKTGKSARFNFVDLLGLAVTRELVNSLGVHIGTVSKSVDTLFKLLANANASTLHGTVVWMTPTEIEIRESYPEDPGAVPTEPTLVIPLAPLIEELQRCMLPVMPTPAQASLPFPPKAVRSRA